MTTRIPVQFELSTASDKLPDSVPYVPPVSHDPEVAAGRRELPSGALVLAQQYIGAFTAELLTERMTAGGLSKRGTKFTSELLAAAAFGSAQYSLRGGRPVMRRHLALPVLVGRASGEAMSPETQADRTIGQFRLTTLRAEDVLREKIHTGGNDLRTLHSFGRAAGTAALWAALLQYPDIGRQDSVLQVQRNVRQAGMTALETTRALEKAIGERLSLAMLGGPTTNLTAYVERHAPDDAYKALSDARQEVQALLAA